MKLDLDMLLGKLLTVEQRTSATAPLDDVAYSSRAALQHHQPAAPRHPLSHAQRHLPVYSRQTRHHGWQSRPFLRTNATSAAVADIYDEIVSDASKQHSRLLPVNGRHLDIATNIQSPSRH